MSPVEHVIHAARRAHNYVGGLGLKLLDLAAEIGPSDAGVASGPHVVTEGQDDFLNLKSGQKHKTKHTGLRVTPKNGSPRRQTGE